MNGEFELKIGGFKKCKFSQLHQLSILKKLLDLAHENLVNWRKRHGGGSDQTMWLLDHFSVKNIFFFKIEMIQNEMNKRFSE